MKIKDISVDLFQDSGMLFRLQATHNTEFTNIGIDHLKASSMDFEYFINRSREKEVTPIVEFLYEELVEQYPLQPKNVILSYLYQRLNEIIYNKFYSNWERLYKSLFANYNPIHNYSMEEDEKVNSKTTITNDNSNDVYGFNSSQSSPTDKSHSSTTTEGSDDDNKRNLVRKGNVGVTSTQRMITEELKLRETKYFELIYKDIDSLLTLKIYC